MKALQFDKTGSLDYLKVKELDRPKIGSGEVLVKVKAAAINPSDVGNVQGKFQQTTLPRIPGRDFAGIVESDSKWKGRAVFGTGGMLGITRDGTQAEYVAVPEDGLVLKPENISFAHAAAMGLGYLAAWRSIVESGKLKENETILITGAAGSVGSSAARIALYLKAKVIGTHLTSDKMPEDLLKTVQWINLDESQLPDKALELTNKQGVNLVFDVIGGKLFEPCLKSLAIEGRQVCIASPSQPRVELNLVDFYHKENQLIGIDTFKSSIEDAAKILNKLLPGITDGSFISQEVEEIKIEDAPKAYEEINAHKAKLKKVIVF